MTGPEHYREAENLTARAVAALTSDDNRIAGQGRQIAHNMLIGRAQVHATLALAAATAQNIRRNGLILRDGENAEGWDAVLR